MNNAAIDERPMMAKHQPKTVAVRLHEDLARMVKIVAAYRDETVAEYLGALLRPLVKADLAKHQRQRKVQEESDE